MRQWRNGDLYNGEFRLGEVSRGTGRARVGDARPRLRGRVEGSARGARLLSATLCQLRVACGKAEAQCAVLDMNSVCVSRTKGG